MKRKEKMVKRAREYRLSFLEIGEDIDKLSAELVSLRAILAKPTSNKIRNRRKRGIFETASGKIIRRRK